MDLTVEYLEGQKGFKLIFDFGEGAQEFFTNKTLVKTYVYQDEVGVRYISFGELFQNRTLVDWLWNYSTKATWCTTMLREREW